MKPGGDNMAEQTPIKVLFQFTLGNPFFTASDAARQQALAEWRDVLRKWKASGVRLIGTFATYGQPAVGYANTVLLEVPHIEMLHQMNLDANGGTIGALKVGHHFTPGVRNAIVEEWWQEG
jgi:hypothetical protein